MSLCTCLERPRCEMIACTAYAEFTAVRTGWAKFLCAWHAQRYREFMTKRVPGLEPHPEASNEEREAFRPSLQDMIRHAEFAMAFERRKVQPPIMSRRGDERYTSAQIKQVHHLREMTRQLRQR